MEGVKNLMVTVSGGRSSALMARHIQTSELYADYEKVYVFANTGMERPETIDFLKKIESVWGIDLVKIEGVFSPVMNVGVRHRVVDWDGLDMEAKVFEGCVMHLNKGDFSGLPFSGAPYCSPYMKTMPCESFANEVFGKGNYKKAIGYRAEDMPKRITWADVKHDDFRIFPLLTDFEYPVDQRFLSEWWACQEFRLGISGRYGNCELCWKKSNNNLAEVIQRGTRFVDWYRRMEREYGNTSFRGGMSIDDLVKMASRPQTGSLFPEEAQDDFEGCGCSM